MLPEQQPADSASRRRQRQMLRRHLSDRRGYKAGCGDRSSRLQANLYRFLGERPSAEMQSLRTDERDGKTNVNKPERRDVLLGAIESLQRLSMEPANTTLLSGSNANGCTEPHKPLLSDNGHELTEQAQLLGDNLRYLALACNPAVTRARPGRSSCAGAEITKRITGARRKIDRLLRQLSGLESGCCTARASAPVDGAPCQQDPLFWRFPACESAGASDKSQLRHHECSQKLRLRRGRRQQRQDDPVAQQMALSKTALIGDPVFQVNCFGQEHRWGRMTLPTISAGLNAADRLGRKNLHRRRLTEHRDAVRAEIVDFANRMEEKWEAFEDDRMDKSIDAACRRLRRALRLGPKRKSKKQRRPALHTQLPTPTPQCSAEFVSQTNGLPSMMDISEGASNNVLQSGNRSLRRVKTYLRMGSLTALQ
uniref:BHLH domain-containing protein n=1 Tax=Macrostomum lignano TaxID=282301 RepID=A0A1I8I996_9PLAT